MSDGVYELSVTMQTAGQYCMLVSLNQTAELPNNKLAGQVAPLEVEVQCQAAEISPRHCLVELQNQPWVAGQTACLTVSKRDRYSALLI